jgi:nitrogen fixation protein FixH
MNLLVSIFGGMLLTAVLYGAGRRARLSNFWSAVVAAGLPSFAYLLYAGARWPGLDVVTLHVVTYPTVAVLLSQLYGAKADHARSLHWAPKLMIVFFVCLSVVYGGLVYVAGNGLPPALARLLLPNVADKNIHTGFAGVVEHHREAAKVIGQHQKMEARLARLGWAVEATGLSSAVAGQAVPVVVRLRDGSGAGVEGVEVSVALTRPGQQGQGEVLPLIPIRAGDYQGQLPALAAGSWVARIGLRYRGEMIVLENTLSAR